MDPEILGPLGLAVGGGLGVLVISLVKYLKKEPTDAPAAPTPPVSTPANGSVHTGPDGINAKLDILVEDLKYRARDRAHDQMARHAASQTAETVASMTMSMQRQNQRLDAISRDVEEVLDHVRRRS